MIACFLTPQIGISCERSRAPELWDRSFILESCGIVRVACPAASSRGISPGFSVTTARSLCAMLIVLPYDMEVYADCAETIWNLIATETNTVEPITNEVCYAELIGCDSTSRAKYIADRISKQTGTPLFVGVGDSKIISLSAALRSSFEGLQSCRHVSSAEASSFIRTLLVKDLPIPTNILQRCLRLGLETMGDIAAIPLTELERQFSKAQARRLSRLLLGEDDDPVLALWPKPNIEERCSFDTEVSELNIMNFILQTKAIAIARQLLEKDQFCRKLTLNINFADGSSQSSSENLSSSQRESKILFRSAARLFSRQNVQKPLTGLILSARDLGKGLGLQPALFEGEGHGLGCPLERQINLDAAIRLTCRKFGPSAIVPAEVLNRIDLAHIWTSTLGKRRNERVQVVLDAGDQPVSYCRSESNVHSNFTKVQEIVDRWREAGWSWGIERAIDYFRVTNELGEIHELQKRGNEWRLCGVVD